MNLYEIKFKGIARVRAESEQDAEDRFSNEDWISRYIDVDEVTEVEGVEEDG